MAEGDGVDRRVGIGEGADGPIRRGPARTGMPVRQPDADLLNRHDAHEAEPSHELVNGTDVRRVSKMMPSTASLVVFLVAAILAGCARTDWSTNPTAGQEAEELVATGAALEPGQYTRSGFEPAITIELDEGWQAVQMGDGFFDVQQRVGTADVIAVQFARPSAVIGGDGAAEAGSHADAVEALQANPSLTVVETSDSRIGGMEGSQVTVENAGKARASIMMVPLGPLAIDPGRRLWIAFFDVPDGLLAIMVGGSTATWDETLATAEPVLESVRIGP